MILDVILGNNIDTLMWIKNLQGNEADCLIIVDYAFNDEPTEIEGAIYMSPIQAHRYIGKFDSVNFYKSLYVYPGMQGNMSSLYKKDKN